MKRYIVCIVVALIACVAQVSAVEFKNTYRPTGKVYQPAVMPSISFQSTSAYSTRWEEQPSMLNADGSVNTEAYGVGRSNASGPRRVGGNGQSGTPGQSGTQQPIGDGLLVLMILAGGYGMRRARLARSNRSTR